MKTTNLRELMDAWSSLIGLGPTKCNLHYFIGSKKKPTKKNYKLDFQFEVNNN